MNDNPLPEKTINQQTASAVHLIIQANRLQDGSRKVTSISEIIGMEGDIVTMQEIFKFYQYGVDNEGKVIGEHLPTGIRPRFTDMCASKGIDLPSEIFIPQPTLPQGKALFNQQDASPSEAKNAPSLSSGFGLFGSQSSPPSTNTSDAGGLRQALLRKKDP